ncbi:MAG: YdbH domain-containing protein [Parasphingorhabdus sp.]
MEEETDFEPIGSRFRKRTAIYIVLFLLLIGFLVIWFSRISIAENLVETELAALNVDADYEIADIGLNKQIIKNLVLGDPERPDLTAELVEIGNSITTSGPGINWLRAKNVKLFGRVVDGQITFGELDKFMDPQDDSPLALPDMWLGIQSGQARIETEFGVVGLTINGEGHLYDGFDGEIAAISKTLELDGCTINNPSFFGAVAISNKKPKLTGPLRLPSAKCEDQKFSSEDIAAQINLTLGEDLASWRGNVGLIGGPVKYAAYSAQEVKTSFDVDGDLIQSSGDIELTASGLQSPYAGANMARVSGPLRLSYGGDQFGAAFEGQPIIRSARLSRNLVGQINSAIEATQNTPIGPVTNKLIAAINRASNNLNIQSDIKLELRQGAGNLLVETLEASSQSGASTRISDPLALIFDKNGFAMGGDSNILLSGGGFPQTRIALDSGSLAAGLSGRLDMASYQSDSSKLTIPSLRFTPARGGGTNIDGRLLISGPLPDGQITGLQLPISGRIGSSGDFAMFRQCVAVQFASLRISTLSAGPTRTKLCPQGGSIVSGNQNGVNIAARADGLNLNGAIGGTPLSIASGGFGFSLRNGLQAQNVAIKLGTGDDQTTMDMALLTAAFERRISGKIEGANGRIANVPLLMEHIEGDWRYVDGAFLADAMMHVRDAENEERFRPLISRDVALQFADGKISAKGNLLEPTTETKVASVDIIHQLSSATGRALLGVSGVNFNDDFQPELLTPLTLGVIANLQGSIEGNGQIEWDDSDDGIKSSGTFKSNGLNLAAAFGPVTGLSGEIAFSDLLELTTHPGQTVKMAEVNPGVAVFNGLLNYRLLPDFKMEIEGGEWPFAGGRLLLEPSILDLSEEAERRLVFTVEGVDASQFLTQFDFENMSATGIFDGKLPMVFDQDGGRIAGGYLVAREGGGSLSYVGELTYEDMGTFANFAFNALKSVKYRNLTIGMDGAIDGEIITEVKFAGLQQGDTASKNFITKQLAKIPIEFNVRIQAPFMQLMSSAKAYYEPEILVGQNLPALLRATEARAQEAVKEIKEVDE